MGSDEKREGRWRKGGEREGEEGEEGEEVGVREGGWWKRVKKG